MTDVTVAGETLRLLPECAAYWPRRATLFIAAPQFGRPATARQTLPPETVLTADLARLTRALARTDAKRLIVLGDLLYPHALQEPRILSALHSWRLHHQHLLVDVVLKQPSQNLPEEWRIRLAAAPTPGPHFVLSDHLVTPDAGYALVGGLNPAVRSAAGRRSACFWFSERFGALPAFTSRRGGTLIAPGPQDRVYLLSDQSVIAAHSTHA
jgi:hypothetical protein